jgi:hypothetical protein
MGGEAWDEVVPLDMSHESQYYDCWNVYMYMCVCVYVSIACTNTIGLP